VRPVDQVILDRVGRGVDQFVQHGVAADELHHADLLRRPEVLPSSPERVLAAREDHVKPLDELRIASQRS
jgi:hypothetical protein